VAEVICVLPRVLLLLPVVLLLFLRHVRRLPAHGTTARVQHHHPLRAVDRIMKLGRILPAVGRGAVLAIVAFGGAPVLAADPNAVAAASTMEYVAAAGGTNGIRYHVAQTGMQLGIGLATELSTESRPTVASWEVESAKLLRIEAGHSDNAASELRGLLTGQLGRTRIGLGRHPIRVHVTIGF